MQAAIVNPQVEFTSLKNLAPQQNPVSQPEIFSVQKKSFEELIQNAKQTDSKPVENEAAYKSQKTEDKAPEKIQETAEKSQNVEKTAEETKTDEEKSVFNAEKKEIAKNKISENDFNKLNVNEELKNQIPETKAVQKNEKSEKISFADMEKILKNAKKIGQDENEKAALTIEDIKNLLEDDNAELFASITQAENLVKAQKNEDFSDLSQISQNIFNEIEDIDSVEGKNARTFDFDKEGKIIVKDLRTEKSEKTEESQSVQDEKKTADSKELTVTDVKFDRNNAEMTMEVANNVQQNVVSSSDQTASAQGSNFQAMLTNQIQQNAGEIVKAGSIVLKDNDVGSIKLILKPESLGNVKVDLQISDKNITGRIVVASQEAFNAFKDSADSLKQAFIDSGFENASLDLAFAGQNASGSESGSHQENPAANYQMSRTYNDYAEGSSVYYEEELEESVNRTGINIVA